MGRRRTTGRRWSTWMTVSGGLGRMQGMDRGPTERISLAVPGELAQFAGMWPQQDELRSANLSDPASVLG
ncbi:hypothetical protein Nmel_018717, partial [Mimus melanotis]